MKAAVLTKVGHIEIENKERPQIAEPGQVLVRVKMVGICGTDLHIYEHGRADVTLPRVMGHELSGIVERAGEAVTRFSPGDSVVLDPVFACGHCTTCKNGYGNICEEVRCFGVQMEGGFQEYIVVDQGRLHPYSSSVLTFSQAALAEPFSIAAQILDRLSLMQEDCVLLMGAGTIGLAVLQVAKLIGAEVMVADIVDVKLEKARLLGADKVVNSSSTALEDEARSFSPNGFSVVIDAVGITPLFQQSIGFAAPRGRVACIGFDATPAEISPVIITKKELSIIGSRMNCGKFPKVIRWLEESKLNTESMITGTYQLDQIDQAFKDALANKSGNIKTLIEIG